MRGILTNNQVDVGRLRKFEGIQKSKQAANYNNTLDTREKNPIVPEQNVVIREPRETPSLATVVAAQEREAVNDQLNDRW